MFLDLLLAFGFGLVIILNPCVLPVVPLVLGSALHAHRLGPLALVAGLCLSLALVTLGLAALGLDERFQGRWLVPLGGALLIALGLILLLPALSDRFSRLTSGLGQGGDALLARAGLSGLPGQALGGAVLGLVWAPCNGPFLIGFVLLASSSSQGFWQAVPIILAFTAGVALVMLALAYGTREALRRREGLMRQLARVSKPVTGLILLGVGLLFLTGLYKPIEAALLGLMPDWLLSLVVG